MNEEYGDGNTEEYDPLDLPDEIDLDEAYTEAPEGADEEVLEAVEEDVYQEDLSGEVEPATAQEYVSQQLAALPPELFTDAEREQLEEMMISNPVQANILMTQRVVQREMASNAILNQSLAPIAAKAPRLVNAYGAQVQQAATMLTAEAKSNPRQAEAMTWGMVLSNEIAQHGVVEAIRRAGKLLDAEAPRPQQRSAPVPQKAAPAPKQKMAPAQRVATGIPTRASAPAQPQTRRQSANAAIADIFGVDPSIVAGI